MVTLPFHHNKKNKNTWKRKNRIKSFICSSVSLGCGGVSGGGGATAGGAAAGGPAHPDGILDSVGSSLGHLHHLLARLLHETPGLLSTLLAGLLARLRRLARLVHHLILLDLHTRSTLFTTIQLELNNNNPNIFHIKDLLECYKW